jgi:hypothetical protein
MDHDVPDSSDEIKRLEELLLMRLRWFRKIDFDIGLSARR